MFESAELGNFLSKKRYKQVETRLRVDLLKAQHALAKSDLSLIVIIAGLEASGKTEFANVLLGWIDARGVETHALGKPSDEERERLEDLESDPHTRWRVTKWDWKFNTKYGRYLKICERALLKTSLPEVPWKIVEGTDRRYRDAEAARLILESLRLKLGRNEE